MKKYFYSKATDSLIEFDTERGSIAHLECAGMLPNAIPETELKEMLAPKSEPTKRKGKLRELINERKPKPGKKSGKVRKCGNCGEPGHRREKCTKPGGGGVSIMKKREPVEKETYDLVKERQWMDDNARDVAERYELDLESVNEIFAASSYDLYDRGYKPTNVALAALTTR